MLHLEYHKHLSSCFLSFHETDDFWKLLVSYAKEFTIIANLNLDPVIPLLNSLYSPVHRAAPKDPISMLRSLLLMTSTKEASITKWVKNTRALSLYAIMAGFHPDDTPGIGTYYDFMKRLIDGPYQKPCEHRTQKKSEFISGLHRRNFQSEKDAKKDEFDPNCSQSERLVEKLLAQANEPRPNGFEKVLEDLLFKVGILPSIQEGALSGLDHLLLSGDGSILRTAASSRGKPTCSCRSQGIYRCAHDRDYTSPTAKWCYDAYRDCYLFGDRYYHLVVHQNGHDLPLLTVMPGGNESDYTLSLKAFDRFLKAANENGLDMHIDIFCGDGHHDSCAHYRYFQEKAVSPVIPLSEKSKNVYPHLLEDRGIRLDTDGVPLCPEGVRMRHHQFDAKKRVHVYTCPVKRNTHRNGKSVYITHREECPREKDCAPDSSLAPLVYIKSEIDPRLYPPIPRDSERFKELYKERTATERGNSLIDTYHLDRSSRNADYGLIRLTLVNIVEHALIRYRDALKSTSADKLLARTLDRIPVVYREEYLDTG